MASLESDISNFIEKHFVPVDELPPALVLAVELIKFQATNPENGLVDPQCIDMLLGDMRLILDEFVESEPPYVIPD